MKKKVKDDGFNVSAVYWTDAAEGYDTWPAVTFGFITHLDKEKVTVVGEVFKDGDTRNESSIPMKIVKKIVTIKGNAPSIKKVFGIK